MNGQHNRLSKTSIKFIALLSENCEALLDDLERGQLLQQDEVLDVSDKAHNFILQAMEASNVAMRIDSKFSVQRNKEQSDLSKSSHSCRRASRSAPSAVFRDARTNVSKSIRPSCLHCPQLYRVRLAMFAMCSRSRKVCRTLMNCRTTVFSGRFW